jgi:hypothetical protein
MRLTAMLVLLMTSPLCSQEEDGERVCRKMEKCIMEAKTLRLTFALTAEVDDRKDKLQGTIWLGEGNKARIEVTGTMPGGKELKMQMVSDGTRMVAKVSGNPDRPPRDTPKTCGDIIRGTIGRAGVFAGLFYGINEKDEPKLDDLFQTYDFKIGGRQKQAKRDLLAIEHKISFRGAKDKGMITVVIDTDPNLPVRRIFTINDAVHKVRIFEEYAEFSIDTKLNQATFDLPE